MAAVPLCQLGTLPLHLPRQLQLVARLLLAGLIAVAPGNLVGLTPERYLHGFAAKGSRP